MACLRAALFVVIVAPALAAQVSAPAGAGPGAPALFAANCAKCHGLDGSGTGPAVLDRPARNFKEGGFSFGNTPETIARTIAHGIPGSPMPSFESALSEEQRRALAAYVITLGPPVKEVSEAEELLHVTDRPVIARGILPPLTEGGPLIPRGLLIGTTDGLTFEYAADDVRLLAVRLGDFAKRTDWGGRGGTPLEPLGKVVWNDDNATGPWSLAGLESASVQGTTTEGRALSARLMSTATSPTAAVSYALLPAGDDGPACALVEERPGLASLGKLAGFSRRFVIMRLYDHDRERSGAIELRLGGWTETLVPSKSVDAGESWWMRTLAPNVGELLHVVDEPMPLVPFALVSDPSGLRGRVSLARLPDHRGSDAGGDDQDHVRFTLESFVVSPWTPESIADLRKTVTR